MTTNWFAFVFYNTFSMCATQQLSRCNIYYELQGREIFNEHRGTLIVSCCRYPLFDLFTHKTRSLALPLFGFNCVTAGFLSPSYCTLWWESMERTTLGMQKWLQISTLTMLPSFWVQWTNRESIFWHWENTSTIEVDKKGRQFEPLTRNSALSMFVVSKCLFLPVNCYVVSFCL